MTEMTAITEIDNCEIASTSVDVNSFSCADIGDNAVILTVEDLGGLTSTCSAIVTVEGSVSVSALCQDVTVQLDVNGDASITPQQVGDDYSAPCGLASLTLDQLDFTCNDLGDNEVTLTVTDVIGNTATCTATITVEDVEAPTALCQGVTLELDGNGQATLAPEQMDDGSSDNCGSIALSVSETSFNCDSPFFTSVSLTVTDDSGNQSQCTAEVIVIDGTDPSAVCQPVTVQLSAPTMAASALDAGSNDNCTAPADLLIAFSFSPDGTPFFQSKTFNCSHVGENPVFLYVHDEVGRSNSCATTITVVDDIPPVASCQDVTLELTDAGLGAITPDEVNDNSSDACGLQPLTLIC